MTGPAIGTCSNAGGTFQLHIVPEAQRLPWETFCGARAVGLYDIAKLGQLVRPGRIPCPRCFRLALWSPETMAAFG